MELRVDHVQGDPHGPPSRVSLLLAPDFHPLLASLSGSDGFRRRAAEDLFLRAFAKAVPHESRAAGDGPGGKVRTCVPGPEILARSAVSLGPAGLRLRLACHLPGEGRRILGRAIGDLLMERLPALALDLARAVREIDVDRLEAHLRRRAALRSAMAGAGLVAFLPDGSVAARDAEGRARRRAVPLEVPPELATELEDGTGKRLRGLGIGPGVTVLVGAAFHGKTTLLEALRRCAFDLGSQDGLALACAIPETEFVAVEEDRRVAPCDLSPFFRRLPGPVGPSRFEADEASGSTSQAANVHEALAVGTRLLLVDEDASAANFLTRDPRIAALLPEGETVVPLASRARELAARGVSLVVVAGASSEWLAVADRVVALCDYQPRDVTAKARKVVAEHGISVAEPEPADWDASLASPTLEALKPLGDVPASKLRVQDGLVRFGTTAQARMPRRFGDDDRLRAAALVLCDWIRHCRDRARTPDRDGLSAFLAERCERGKLWDDQVGHDLAEPTPREVWGLRTRLASAEAEG